MASVSITTPANQTSAAGASASLGISATDSGSLGLTYTASGLPSWLSINPSTGAITGTAPTAPTTVAGITVTATDTQGASATTSAFGWTVTPAAPSKVVFTTQPPTSGTAGVALSSFAVSVEDQYGNVETTGNTGSADAIALSVHSGPGSITSGLSATASNGVATFAATVIDTAGSYTFTATDSSRSISTANSTPITVIAPSGTTSLTLSPGTASVAAGVGQAYTATGYDTYGNSTGNVTGSTTFSITPNGAGTGAACTGTSCTATKAGTYTVKGTDGAATGTATLTVTAGPTASLALSPANADVVAGGSQAYTATGYDTYGNTTGNVTGSTTFTIAPNGAGTGASCTGTSCTASALGSYTVTGTDGSATGTANLTVSAGPPATLTLSPASATVAAGTGQAYTATGYDTYGNTTGNVTGSTTFTIAPNGAGTGASCTGASCTATEAGTYTVTGTDGTATGTATLTVTAAAPATLVLDPTSASIVSGNDQSYTASGTDAYGNSNGDVTSSTTFTISPDGAGTGAVCTGPICTATKAGTYTVTGTDGSASATSSLVVRGATTMTVKTVATDDPSNVISIAYNTTVKYEVTVTGTNGSGAPTGTVSFSPTNTDCRRAAAQCRGRRDGHRQLRHHHRVRRGRRVGHRHHGLRRGPDLRALVGQLDPPGPRGAARRGDHHPQPIAAGQRRGDHDHRHGDRLDDRHADRHGHLHQPDHQGRHLRRRPGGGDRRARALHGDRVVRRAVRRDGRRQRCLVHRGCGVLGRRQLHGRIGEPAGHTGRQRRLHAERHGAGRTAEARRQGQPARHRRRERRRRHRQGPVPGQRITGFLRRDDIGDRQRVVLVHDGVHRDPDGDRHLRRQHHLCRQHVVGLADVRRGGHRLGDRPQAVAVGYPHTRGGGLADHGDHDGLARRRPEHRPPREPSPSTSA